MTDTTTTPTTVTIPGPIAARLLRARGAMPYGAAVHAPGFVALGRRTADDSYAGSELDLEVLADYLEALGAVLAGHALECQDRAETLDRLESDLRGVGRVLARISRSSS